MGWKDLPLKPTASFVRAANSNFIDICVLEWCKLFGDKVGAKNADQHSWWRIVSDTAHFESEMLNRLGVSPEDFHAYRITMRSYRDKFLAHLDSDLVMNIPRLDIAEASVRFYHEYLVSTEAKVGDLPGLVDTTAKLDRGYAECEKEAAQAYAALIA